MTFGNYLIKHNAKIHDINNHSVRHIQNKAQISLMNILLLSMPIAELYTHTHKHIYSSELYTYNLLYILYSAYVYIHIYAISRTHSLSLSIYTYIQSQWEEYAPLQKMLEMASGEIGENTYLIWSL